MTDATAPAAQPANGFRSVLIELLVVALIGVGAGASFELVRPAASAADKPKEAAASVEP
jgi:hypothetical protein